MKTSNIIQNVNKHSQASWILCSVKTPWLQSETLRMTCARHDFNLCLGPGLSYPLWRPGFCSGLCSGGSETSPCHFCLYWRPTDFHCSRWGWPFSPRVRIQGTMRLHWILTGDGLIRGVFRFVWKSEPRYSTSHKDVRYMWYIVIEVTNSLTLY